MSHRTLLATSCLAFALASFEIAAHACPPEPPRPPPPPIEEGPRGRLSVRADPEGQVFVDGRNVGLTPVVGLWLDPGRHSVRLVASCGETRRDVRVPARSDVSLHLRPCPPRTASRLPE
jgi:hypothetical protein